MLRSREEALDHLIDQLCQAQVADFQAWPEETHIPLEAQTALTCYRNEVASTILDLVGRN